MTPAAATRFRLLASVLSILVLLGAGTGAWFYFKLRASLPALDGSAALHGLTAAVTIQRDALGVPTLRGATRVDLARALGYVHAQDRFFQMDTLRRIAAGELSELVGKATVPRDRAARLHGFRKIAQTALARLAPTERALLEAYAAGVNHGLSSLGAKPFEYLALRVTPQNWRPEDSLLVGYAMTLDLQEGTGNYERSLMVLRDQYGMSGVAFFAPVSTPDDAALDGTTAPVAPIPGAQLIRLAASTPPPAATAPADDFMVGSNSFALAGNRTATGGALLANDMHLDLRVPNTWYRASLEWNDATPGAPPHRVTGVTLPGAPIIISGSNGRIAWGFTNSVTDTSDLVVVEVNVTDRSLYAYQKNLLEFEKRREKILVKGGEPVEIETLWTVWGPVIGVNDRNRPLALHWTAHDPEASNVTLAGLETARTLDEAIGIAQRAGIPTQNFLVADADGHIAWSLAGRLPKRFGYDGRLPTAWYYGDRGWKGLLPPEEVPVVRNPPSGQLWTANARVLGGGALTLLGDGGYDRPARAAQIRDDLTALQQPAAAKDLLAIQLDDRAVFLARWQKLLLATLTPEAIAQKKSRGELRALVEKWDGRASVDSISYRLVRNWRQVVSQFVFTPVFAPCREEYEQFSWNKFQYESALWTLLQQKPGHLLSPHFSSWDALCVAAADRVLDDLSQQGVPLSRATWGRRNTAQIIHPLARSLPSWLTGWLSMPSDQLPGDSDMPRVQGPTSGASERMVVSPGREAEGIFHMPGGQSGHPLSPFFRAGHAAWVRGEPTPFLPGASVHTLKLNP